MPETFNFSPGRYVPETLPPEPMSGMTMNGWSFSSKPNVPYQRRFRLKLYGLRWYTNPTTDYFDATINPDFNAHALELFYARHQNWNPFLFTHQHLGLMTCKFQGAVTVPAAPEGSGGWLDPVEVTLIHHNPGY